MLRAQLSAWCFASFVPETLRSSKNESFWTSEGIGYQARWFAFPMRRQSGIHTILGHRSQRLQWPIVITRCPASVRPSVRPSVVRRPLDYLHFRLLLQNRLMNFDETWYGWSTQGPLQVLLFFGQIRPGADPGRGKNRSRGVPFFRKLLLQTGRLQQQTKCIEVI